MAKTAEKTGYWSQFFSPKLYKRNQGRLTRQLTAVCLGLLLYYGLYQLYKGPIATSDAGPAFKVGLPLVLLLFGAWAIFRLINYPRFADFLVNVQGEMDKVTWSDKKELHRSTVVVLITMFIIGAMLFLFDMFWRWAFYGIGFLRVNPFGGGEDDKEEAALQLFDAVSTWFC